MTTEEQKKKKRKEVLNTIGAVVGVLLLVSCCGIGGLAFLGSETPTAPTPVAAPTVTYGWLELESSPVPENWTPPAMTTLTLTPRPTMTPQPTVIPTIVPLVVSTTEPVVLAEISGIGNVVTENFVWPQCQKAVFYWSVEPDSYGNAYLIVHLWRVGKDRQVYLINEGEFDQLEPLEGAALQPLAGGEYYFATDNCSSAWTILVMCED